MYSLVCVGPGRKHRLLVFSCKGSHVCNLGSSVLIDIAVSICEVLSGFDELNLLESLDIHIRKITCHFQDLTL